MLDEQSQNFIVNAACAAQDAIRIAAYAAQDVELDKIRPFSRIRPKVFPDGNQWCALYGDNLQTGVCGFGDTPEKAAVAFDLAWLNATPPPTNIEGSK